VARIPDVTVRHMKILLNRKVRKANKNPSDREKLSKRIPQTGRNSYLCRKLTEDDSYYIEKAGMIAQLCEPGVSFFSSR
jgi:hypothetical protein